MDIEENALGVLNKNTSLSEKLIAIHEALHKQMAVVDRVSVAVYDPKTDLLKTFIHSSGNADPLSNYQARLSDVKSLQEVISSGKARVVNDLEAHYRGPSEHSRKITTQGYGSSYTLPMYLNGVFFGFVSLTPIRKTPSMPNS